MNFNKYFEIFLVIRYSFCNGFSKMHIVLRSNIILSKLASGNNETKVVLYMRIMDHVLTRIKVEQNLSRRGKIKPVMEKC